MLVAGPGSERSHCQGGGWQADDVTGRVPLGPSAGQEAAAGVLSAQVGRHNGFSNIDGDRACLIMLPKVVSGLLVGLWQCWAEC
jgi:hypothetical protein